MSSPASIAGHPIHPMLVALPIGLWIFSLVSDVIFLAGLGAPVWNDVAFYTMAGGIVGALLAAVPGLIDFLSIEDARVKKIGAMHMALNLVAVALYAVNLWLRTSSSPGSKLPVGLSVLTVLMLAVSGWLGGEMVYVHGISVDPQHDTPGQERDKIRAA